MGRPVLFFCSRLHLRKSTWRSLCGASLRRTSSRTYSITTLKRASSSTCSLAAKAGRVPSLPTMIDHINGDRADNRWGNLRLADYRQQVWNTPAHHHCKSQLKGAWPCKTTGRWQSLLQDGKERIWLGRFDTAEEAHAAWVRAAIERRGKEWMQRAIAA